MSAVNPYTPPRASVRDVPQHAGEYSTPKVWSASGRIGRLRYLAYMMVAYLVLLLAFLVMAVLGAVMRVNPGFIGVLVILSFIPYVIVVVLAHIQRAHDIDWSGWSVLLSLIPLVNFVWLLVLLFKAGTADENRFGAPPIPNTTGVKVGAALVLVAPMMIGILAAVSLPAYQDYVKRAKAAQMKQQMQPPMNEQPRSAE